jgi:putative ABC transport system ATP-binding protein
VLDPPLVLADEPTGRLDSRSGQAVIELLARAAEQQGTSVVVVSRDPRIQPFAHRVLRMEDGRLTHGTGDLRERGSHTSRMEAG